MGTRHSPENCQVLVVTAIYTVGALCAAKMCPDEIAIPTQTTKCSITVRNLPVSTFVHKGRLHYTLFISKKKRRPTLGVFYWDHLSVRLCRRQIDRPM